jgi:hypothetical protein
MRDLVLIIPLNSQNPSVSNAKMSHRVALSMGGSGIGAVLSTFLLISFCKRSDADQSHRTMLSWKR